MDCPWDGRLQWLLSVWERGALVKRTLKRPCGLRGGLYQAIIMNSMERCTQLAPWAMGNPFITTMLSSGAPDYCKRFWVHFHEAAEAAAACPHNYTEQTMSHLSQVQNIAVTWRLSSTSVDPDRQTLLPHSGAAAATAHHFLLRWRGQEPPESCSRAVHPTGAEGYGYGLHSELSQASAEACSSLWRGPVRTGAVCGLSWVLSLWKAGGRITADCRSSHHCHIGELALHGPPCGHVSTTSCLSKQRSLWPTMFSFFF